ncbi:MAG: hypothetical protein HY908_20870 [Myxococcales bacterium]|nr:hypothetical protein [Myxococcales bacterium]
MHPTGQCKREITTEFGLVRRALRRSPGEPGAGGTAEAEDELRDEAATDRARRLLCAGCRSPVTDTAARVAIGGSHEHTFVNPSGYVFRIGCFRAAPGCTHVGDSSTEWSWFPGHAWQVALCGRCSVHLGWAFSADGREALFHGLVLDRLVEDEPGAA